MIKIGILNAVKIQSTDYQLVEMGKPMQKKSLKKTYVCVATTMLMGQFVLFSDTTHATEKEQAVPTEQSDVNIQNSGLRGVYFHDAHFREPVMIAPSKNGELKLTKETIGNLLSEEKKNFQSVRWIGYLTPSESDEYEFSTSSDEQVMLKIDDKLIIQQAPQKKKLKLEKGKSYEILLEYVPKHGEAHKDINLSLYWATSIMKKQVISEKNIQPPEIAKTENKFKIFPKQSLFYNDISEDLDTDDDSIPDIWEIDGYTVQGQVAVKWDERLANQGYKKYRSNPYRKFTAGDPYTDFQKAANQMDVATNKVAKNPLVAAYPTIGVLLDNITISRNNDITSSWGGDTSTSLTKGTSNSKTNETSEGIDTTASIEIEASITPSLNIGLSVTNTFNKSNSTTATIEESNTDSSGRNWGESIGINTAQSAYLGPRVRYINTGTAPVYQLKPDVSIGMLENHTLTSGIVDETYRANVLNPNEMFPKKESLPILVNKHEGTPISIDFNELLELEKKKTLRLDSTQFDGLVSPTANPEDMKKWDGYINNIEHVTTRIIFMSPDEWTERRIAAPVDPTDPEDMYPEIDLDEAMEIGFENFKKTDKGYQYKDYIFEGLHMIYDEDTARKFKEQAKQNKDGKLNPMEMKLNAGMNIQVSPAGWITNTKTEKKYYFDAESGKLVKGQTQINGQTFYFSDDTGEYIELKDFHQKALQVSPRVVKSSGNKMYIYASTQYGFNYKLEVKVDGIWGTKSVSNLSSGTGYSFNHWGHDKVSLDSRIELYVTHGHCKSLTYKVFDSLKDKVIIETPRDPLPPAGCVPPFIGECPW